MVQLFLSAFITMLNLVLVILINFDYGDVLETEAQNWTVVYTKWVVESLRTLLIKSLNLSQILSTSLSLSL